jgi:hypothetical protein
LGLRERLTQYGHDVFKQRFLASSDAAEITIFTADPGRSAKGDEK